MEDDFIRSDDKAELLRHARCKFCIEREDKMVYKRWAAFNKTSTVKRIGTDDYDDNLYMVLKLAKKMNKIT